MEGQMNLKHGKHGKDSEARFAGFVEGLSSVVGHADRSAPLRDYCIGLMLPGERKSVEPMAARTAPARTAAQHQSLLHFVGVAPWSEEKVLAKVREMVLPSMQRQEPIKAWIIDDTGLPKQGKHSVGVQVQYCGDSARKPIARWPYRCRSQTTLPACRWPIGCICRRSGPEMLRVGTRPACREISASRPSRRSRSIRYGGRARPGFHAGSH